MCADNPAKPAKHRKVRLDELLVDRGLAESRSQAQRLILAGEVSVGGQVLDKAGHARARRCGRETRGKPALRQPGRAQAGARTGRLQPDPSGWVCADVGASTGGFTDCLLQRGATRVYAIDVGYGQLAWSLRQDARVVSIERANIRHLAALPEPVRLAVVDVSFIGLGLVLPHVAALLAPAGDVISLIKPQFEVGKGQVGKGGVVREPALHRYAIEKVLAEAAGAGLAPAGVTRSPITGPAGNVEFLALLRLGGVAPDAETMTRWAHAAVEGEP